MEPLSYSGSITKLDTEIAQGLHRDTFCNGPSEETVRPFSSYHGTGTVRSWATLHASTQPSLRLATLTPINTRSGLRFGRGCACLWFYGEGVIAKAQRSRLCLFMTPSTGDGAFTASPGCLVCLVMKASVSRAWVRFPLFVVEFCFQVESYQRLKHG